MGNIGFVKLHRQLLESNLWTSEPFTKAQAWIDLFANANYAPGSFWVRGIEVKIARGQLGWSEITMAKRWKWSRPKVRRFLSYLEKNEQIKKNVNPVCTSDDHDSEHKTLQQKITTIISIINYEKYQPDTTKKQQTEQQKDNRRDTIKKNNNNKNNYLDDSFEKWWNLYDKKSGRKKAFINWTKLSEETHNLIYLHTKEYVIARSEKTYRKDPANYLKEEIYKELILTKNTNAINNSKEDGKRKFEVLN